MIDRVRIRNYKSIADVTVDLGPLTVLVGKNGSGKSSFVQALKFLRDAFRYDLETALRDQGGLAALRHASDLPDGDIAFEIDATDFRKGGHEYGLTLQDGKRGVKRERWRCAPKPSVWAPGEFDRQDEASLLAPDHPMHVVLANHIKESSFFDIHADDLKPPKPIGAASRLQDDGGNLSDMLDAIKRLEPQQYRGLVGALHAALGDVIDYRCYAHGSYWITELAHQTQGDRVHWFDLYRESDGTLRLLALFTALHQPSQMGILCIEEPEIALHPGVLGIVADAIREASRHQQILITTQSPDLISRFSADEIRVVERVDGVTQIAPLDNAQKSVIEKQLFSAGDLLRIEGLHRAQPDAEAA